MLIVTSSSQTTTLTMPSTPDIITTDITPASTALALALGTLTIGLVASQRRHRYQLSISNVGKHATSRRSK